MATIYNRNNFGLFTNGDFKQADNSNFPWGTFNNAEQFSGNGCLEITGGGGSAAFSNEFIEIDTTKTYQMICYVRTLQRGSQNNSLAGGFLGFACYDSSLRLIDILQCGGIGDTTLSRDVSPGDPFIYLTSNVGWLTGADVTGTSRVFRHVLFYPSTHPEFNRPHEYTRIGVGAPNICYKSMLQTDQGDWEVKLSNVSNADLNMPDIGYLLPAGTPISRGVSAGTYNYALGSPNYPDVWTRLSTAPFTGESRTQSTPFRWATKYIRFLCLLNYNSRLETPQDHIWALDNIFFGISNGGKDYRNIL
jgi:hypothetical protein